MLAVMPTISLEDVCRSYRWLGHQGMLTEVVALHPGYRPGPEHVGWNKEHQTFPRTAYAGSEQALLRFIDEHYANGRRMVCMSLNPRSQAFRNERGFARGAREDEISLNQNILFDFDGKQGAAAGDYRKFAEQARFYFQDDGLKPPVYAETGRGFHFLFAHPALSTREHSDISERIAAFADRFREEFHKELAALGLSLDRTQDLRRMVRVYGTAKPSVGTNSKFYGDERVEDEALASHLLNLRLKREARPVGVGGEPVYGAALVRVYDKLPVVVESLLRHDEKLRDLWEGKSKPASTDISGSGYDYSLARRLIVLGVRDLDVLSTAIALRPGSSYRENGKDEQYLRRTVAAALTK
jgi:hypothetical protein